MATGSFAYTIIVTTARAFRNYPGCTSDRNLRKEIPGDYQQLAVKLNVVRQTVSKWEQGTAYPDIEMLPKLATVLDTTVDALLGYGSVVTDYDKRYNTEGYYWGLTPNHICYDIMKIFPPVKPYRILDIGCGE